MRFSRRNMSSPLSRDERTMRSVVGRPDGRWTTDIYVTLGRNTYTCPRYVCVCTMGPRVSEAVFRGNPKLLSRSSEAIKKTRFTGDGSNGGNNVRRLINERQ